MYSVKPGRGPSLMGGIGGLFVAGFGVVWTIGASSMGAPGFFVAFGVFFIFAALAGAVYNFVNAGSRNRMSTFDITTDREESDPISDALGYSQPPQRRTPRQHIEPRDESTGARKYPGEHCPFCGVKVEANFDFCPKCGKDI